MQLCRVAEIAERQRAVSSSPAPGPQTQTTGSSPKAQPFVLPQALPSLLQGAQSPLLTRPTPSRPAAAPSIFSRMSRGFEQFADVTLVVEVRQHSADAPGWVGDLAFGLSHCEVTPWKAHFGSRRLWGTKEDIPATCKIIMLCVRPELA